MKPDPADKRQHKRVKETFPALAKAESRNDRRYASRHVTEVRDDMPDDKPAPILRATVSDAVGKLAYLHSKAHLILSLTGAGYTIAEIAERVSIAESTVVLLQKHGRAILRALLEIPT